MWLGKLTALDMTPLGWLGRKTSTHINKTLNFNTGEKQQQQQQQQQQQKKKKKKQPKKTTTKNKNKKQKQTDTTSLNTKTRKAIDIWVIWPKTFIGNAVHIRIEWYFQSVLCYVYLRSSFVHKLLLIFVWIVIEILKEFKF